jgi:CRISPR/Cas system CSM-associated protein Csm3 (group 7 of RAMP superfamily)
MKTMLITARLTFATPGGVTAPESATTLEQRDIQGETRVHNLLPLRRDPNGMVHLPGATVAGSLRRHCASRPALDDLFGSSPGQDVRVPSTIHILGCVLLSQPATTQRVRTAVDRVRGAPANRTLHAVEQLPAGTAFDVVMRWNNPDRATLDEFVNALAEWAPSIGRGSALGAGRCTVTALATKDYDLGTVDGLTAWLALSDSPRRAYPEPDPLPATTASTRCHRAVQFTVVDALHIGSGAIRPDPGPKVAAIVRSAGTVIIPGSSVKGVLRSRAEYICRVSAIPTCAGTAPSTCPTERPCPPCRIFGRPANANGDGSRRAAIAIPDAVVTDAIVETRQHVALDRFTGGARDKLLYSDEVLVAGQFTIQLDELAPPLSRADTALIDATLQDLHDGLIGLGARTTAGYGTVHITDPAWTAPDLRNVATLLGKEHA